VPEKNRSAGITVIAILQLIGSALLLAMSAFMAFAMIMAAPPGNDPRLPPMFFTAMRVVLPLFYALPAVWGIVTAVGLLQLKNWARISTIIISILLMVFGAFGILSSMVFFLKPPRATAWIPKCFSS
jgi:predicted ferric reductase